MKSKLLNALQIWKTLVLYFSCIMSYIFWSSFYNKCLSKDFTNKLKLKLKFLTLFLLSSLFFLTYLKKPRCNLIPIWHFFYFLENILSLKSYYQLSYVSIWRTDILLTIANILIKSWNVHFHFVLNWSDAAWSEHDQLKQSMKPYNLNEVVLAITNMSCVYFLSVLECWMFECFVFWKCKHLTFHPPFLSIKPKQPRVW